MNNLKFDLEGAKEQLTQVFRDRIAAQGSVYNVQNVNIEDVAFSELSQKVPNQDQILADMKADLVTAKANGGKWFNDVQPHLTAVPQAVINYSSLWQEAIPLLLIQIRSAEPNRDELQQLFGGLNDSISTQVASLNQLVTSLQTIDAALTTDATNFSAKHLPFQQLEDIDKADIAAARSTLDKIKAMVSQYDTQIEVDMIKAEKDLAIASNAMKYGGKLGKPGKVVGLTIGLIFIVSATFAIDDLLAAVDARLEKAEQAGEYQLELSSLTAQLIALETASSALSGVVDEINDMITTVQQTIAGWQWESAAISKVISDLKGPQSIGLIVNEFDLGETQAQWEDLAVFATKWQTMEVSPKANNELVLGDTPAS